MKRLLILIAISCISLASFAVGGDAASGDMLIISTHDDNTLRVAIDRLPVCRVEGDALVIDHQDGSVSLVIDHIKSYGYTVSNPDVSVTPVLNHTPEVKLLSDNIEITIADEHADTPLSISITDLSGRTVYSETFIHTLSIPISLFTTGIYLLHSPELPTLKFVIR